MLRFIIRRLLQGVIILFGISVVVFILINHIPGNPYLAMFPLDIPQEQIELMLYEVGYYDPVIVKYLKWIIRAFTGDFGYSLFYHRKVMDVIASRMGNTILLTLSSLSVSVLVGVSLGIFTAKRYRKLADHTVSAFTFLFLAFPSFFLGMILIKVFGADLRLLPISGKVTVQADYKGIAYVLDVARHMVMPSLLLGILYSATFLRYTRSNVLGILNADYIRSARARGLTEGQVLSRHILKNILIPIITVLSLELPELLSGALLTETVFLWPGVGRLSYEAVSHRDYPLVMGILLIMAAITLVTNIVADILYALIDQRITLGTEHVVHP
jgi:peptide/nickel transport system permease protein